MSITYRDYATHGMVVCVFQPLVQFGHHLFLPSLQAAHERIGKVIQHFKGMAAGLKENKQVALVTHGDTFDVFMKIMLKASISL